MKNLKRKYTSDFITGRWYYASFYIKFFVLNFRGSMRSFGGKLK